MISVRWRVVWPSLAAMAALRLLSFPLPGGWNPSLVSVPGVSALDAVILVWAGYYGSQRTGRLGTGIATAGVTSVAGAAVFLVYAAVTTPSLLLAPFEKPFIFVIVAIVVAIALGFGMAAGAVGAAAGRSSANGSPTAGASVRRSA